MNIKPLIAFLSGAIIGAGGMYIGMKKHFEKTVDKKVAEERACFHKLLREAQNFGKDLDSSIVEDQDHFIRSKTDIPEESVIDRPIFYNDEGDTQEFQDIMTSYRDILERAHYGEELDLDAMIVQARQTKPFVITMGEYGAIPEHECISLIYSADNMLVDETIPKKIPDEEVNELIGSEAVKELVEGEDYVYVRNRALRIDIEIVNDRARFYSDFVEDQETIYSGGEE